MRISDLEFRRVLFRSPTDEPTLERALNALMPSDGSMCILDPCAGEGVAIAEAAHALGREQVKAFAVEFDAERARHARGLVDHCLHADLMDAMIRSEEHTSELQSLMRISYAVFCLKKK